MHPFVASALATVFLVACSTPPNKSEAPGGLPLIGSSKVWRTQLPNGLKLLVSEDHSSPTFSYHTWFGVGSRNEDEGLTGLAHLFEHMMFKGTKKYPEGQFDKILDRAGAEGLNAFTSYDHTAYVQELPKEQLELIVRLEADRMTQLIVNEESFKTEREVVHNERRMRYENNPDGMLFQALFSASFEKHPYRVPVIGLKEDLDRATADDAAKFYKKFYNPANAVIVVVGDVEYNEVLKWITQYYGSLEGQPVTQPQLPTEAPITSPKRRTLPLNIQVEKLYMAYAIPNKMHPDMAALEMIQGILTRGRSSRLRKALVDTGTATDVDCGAYSLKDSSVFVFTVSLQKGKKAQVAEQIVLRELALLSQRPPSQSELKKVQNGVQYDIYEGLNSQSKKARFLGHWESDTGDYRNGLLFLDSIAKIQASQVQVVAKKTFSPEKRVVLTGVPK